MQIKEKIMKQTGGINRYLWAGILLIFFVLVSYISYTQSIWLDEGLSIDFSKKSLSYIIDLSMKIDLHPPLYYLFLHLTYILFGTSIFIGRFWSELMYLTAGWVFYSYFKAKGFPQKQSVFFLLVYLLSPFAMFYGSETRSYAGIILVSLCQFIYFEKILAQSSKKDKWVYLAWSIAGSYLFYPFIFNLVAQFVYVSVERRDKFKELFLPWFLTFVSYLPWLYFVVLKRAGVVPGHFLPIPWWQIPAVIFVGFSGGRSAITDVNHLHWYWPTVLVSLANVFVLGGLWFWFKDATGRRYLRLLSYLFFIPLIICLFISATRFSIFDPRYYTEIFFIYVIVGAYALSYLMRSYPRLGILAGAALISVNLLFLGLYALNPWFVREPWKMVVQELESQIGTDDAIVFIGVRQPPPTYSAYQRKNTKIISTYTDDLSDLADYKAIGGHLTGELKGIKRVWYSQFLEWQKDPSGEIRKLIERDFRYVRTVGFFKVKFDLYERK